MRFENMISSGETNKAISELVKLFRENKSSLLNEALLIQGRWNQYLKLETSGLLNLDQSLLLKNQINSSILTLYNHNKEKEQYRDVVSTLNKKNYYSRLLSLFLISLVVLLIGFLYNKVKKAEMYEEEISKKDEYIKGLKLNALNLEKRIAILDNRYPQLKELISEFNTLHNSHINAVREGSYNLSSRIETEIYELPDKYNLPNIENEIDVKIKNLNTEIALVDNKSQKGELIKEKLELVKIKKDVGSIGAKLRRPQSTLEEMLMGEIKN